MEESYDRNVNYTGLQKKKQNSIVIIQLAFFLLHTIIKVIFFYYVQILQNFVTKI